MQQLFGVDKDGLLVIQGSQRGAWVRFKTEGVEARARFSPLIKLPWEQFDHAVPSSSSPTWTFGYWTVSRSPFHGLAIYLAPTDDDRREFIRASASRFARFQAWFPDAAQISYWQRYSRIERQLATLCALCDVIVARTHLRARLQDRHRMQRLVVSLNSRPLGHPGPVGGIRPTTIDVGTALRQEGFVHEFARPIGETLAPLPEIVERVRNRISTFPSASRDRVSDEEIERRAREWFLDVEPWPFDPLVKDS